MYFSVFSGYADSIWKRTKIWRKDWFFQIKLRKSSEICFVEKQSVEIVSEGIFLKWWKFDRHFDRHIFGYLSTRILDIIGNNVWSTTDILSKLFSQIMLKLFLNLMRNCLSYYITSTIWNFLYSNFINFIYGRSMRIVLGFLVYFWKK